MRQQVLLLWRFGGPDGFELVDQDLPAPGPGEVRVRVLAASVQFTDLVMRRGKYPDLKQKPPLVLGYDVIGEVHELGPGVTGLQVGNRVADLTMTGSYARYRTLRAEQVVRVPGAVESAQAATVVLSWLTAYQLLHRQAQVRPGQRVLIHGAAGAVGQALLALGRLAGLRLWGTARAKDADLVRSFGATPLDFHRQDSPVFGPGNFDVVFDGVGERGFARSWASLGPGGTLSAYGLSWAVHTGAHWPRWPGGWRGCACGPVANGKSARFFSIFRRYAPAPRLVPDQSPAAAELLADRAIRPLVAERIGLADVADAHRRLEAGGVGGKLVICPDRRSRAVGRRCLPGPALERPEERRRTLEPHQVGHLAGRHRPPGWVRPAR